MKQSYASLINNKRELTKNSNEKFLVSNHNSSLNFLKKYDKNQNSFIDLRSHLENIEH